MKTKTIFLIFILILVAISLVYVYSSEKTPIDNEPDQNIETNNEADNMTIEPIFAGDIDINQYTLLEEYIVDFNNDAVEETVKLYAQVGVSEDGEYMWDDGQKWLLLVYSGKNTYVIFDDYVQLGRLDVKLYESGEDDSVHLTTVLEVGAAYVIKDYTYNTTENNFKEELIYEKSNINWIQKVYH